jgi:hypothetical protein
MNLREMGDEGWSRLISEYRLVRSSCECGSGPSVSAIDGKFLDLLLGYQLLRYTLLQGVS